MQYAIATAGQTQQYRYRYIQSYWQWLVRTGYVFCGTLVFTQRWRALANSCSLAITDMGLTVVEVPCCTRHNANHVHVLSNHVHICNEGSIGASLWRAITHEVLNAKATPIRIVVSHHLTSSTSMRAGGHYTLFIISMQYDCGLQPHFLVYKVTVELICHKYNY